ncbi:mannosyl-glycoprotein endo-beta-N-acetylglucosamidase, partial [Weissella confusa]|nr:mannosyl-glycoprotein endo-beta-N-acetylglucosamidase [Weissella confusa]
TVKSVTANNQGNSHFEYYVEYGNADENNMHVLEQDLQAAPAEKYKQGDVVSIATGAISGTTGQSLTEYRGFTGTVKSVKIKNHASSHYQYALDVGGKTVSYIPEQDVVDAPARKYKAGDKVAISSAANVESNGHNLQPRRGYIGTVKSSAIMNKYSSHYEYYVDYGDGTGNGHVLEQDLITPPAAKY